MGFSDKNATKSKDGEDASGRRAALMEGAISTTINHPNVVQTHDFRVINFSPQGRGPGLPTNRYYRCNGLSANLKEFKVLKMF
jgi:hypothetical protein